MHRVRIFTIALLALAGSFWANALDAAAPAVRSVSVRGLQIGGTTTLVFDGSDLAPNPRVVMSIPIAAQATKPSAAANRVEIDVTLDETPAPGYFNLYLATDEGLSERIVVALDRLSQLPFAPKVEMLPVALHGVVSGSAVTRTSFSGKAGQLVMCEVEAQRLGGRLRPVLHLYDAAGKHLAWSLPAQHLRGDARVAATLPADGEYTLTLNDLQFAAPAPNYFRLRIGQWQFADSAFPAAIERGAPKPVSLVGNVPADKLVSVAPTPESAHLAAPWPDPTASSGPLPAVSVSDIPELVELPPTEALQEIAPMPAAMNGRLLAAGEEDRYLIKVQPDAKLRFELFAARLGAPLDTVLELRRENGQVLASNDDAPGVTDSLLEFTAPKDVEALVVAVRDTHGRGGAYCIYRLVVTPDSPSPPPDFRLSFELDRLSVPADGRQIIKVLAERQGYQGPIRLEFGGLPHGVAAETAEIPAGAGGKLIQLSGAGESASQLVTLLRGVSTEPGSAPLVRVARANGDMQAQSQPWLAEQMGLALALRAGNGFACDALPAADARLVLGGKLQLPVTCVRPPGFDGPVRLALLTSQNPPQANGQNDPNRTLRPESSQPVEIPSDPKAVAAWDAKLAADKVLAEAETALAAALKALADAESAGGEALEKAQKAKTEAEAKLAEAREKQQAAVEAASAASAAAKNDTNYALLVPAELSPGQVELAVRAELLSRDKQKVFITLCTPVRTLPVVNPLKLVLNESKAAGKLDPKTGVTLKIAGQIERLEGFASDITVSATGLPAGIAAPRVVLKPDQTNFELEFKFPANAPTGEVQGIKLFATGKMIPNAPLDVKSAEVPAVIEILPPDEQQP